MLRYHAFSQVICATPNTINRTWGVDNPCDWEGEQCAENNVDAQHDYSDKERFEHFHSGILQSGDEI
jgi:hypothetical protein